MSDGVEAVILCEDLQALVFLRRALVHRGYDKRRIRPVPLPDGVGAGDQYVVRHYAEQVRLHRVRASRMKAVLLVHIDADTETTESRRSRLAEALTAAGETPRDSEETIAILTPKRNIETWIHFFLKGLPVDEQTEYTKLPRESDAWSAAEAFDQASRNEAPTTAPPSAVVGLIEMRRIP